MRIGLLGGSFNPAHAGHRLVADAAARFLRLDQVWLLVSPGNPLKPAAGMAPMAERLAGARAIADGRRVIVTGVEKVFGTRFTVDTLRRLLRHFPCARFVWLCGADILTQLPRWRRWPDIVARLAFVVLPRPGYTRRALAGRIAHRLRRSRRPIRQARLLPGIAPAWLCLPHRELAISSTALRTASKEPAP
jgi:nicotinate-nucleotide adenylyltransferase